MDIIDFLPSYPPVNESRYPVLNPYDENFYEAIFRKAEFYENKLGKSVDPLPNERGMQLKYQKTIARYLSSHTPYDKLFLVHFMGLGKCVLPGTLVNVNGKDKPIESLFSENGERFDGQGYWSLPKMQILTKSFDTENKAIIYLPVEKLYRQYVEEEVREITLNCGTIISATKAHKFYTEQGWTNDIENCKFIAVINHEGNGVFLSRIKGVNTQMYMGWVYDLEVAVHHNYLANGVVTHNTCSAIGVIEQIRSEQSTFDGAIILAKSKGLLKNFRKELVHKCTAGKYIPANYKNLTDNERVRRINKITSFYQTDTFVIFAKGIGKLTDSRIIENYSNKIIVLDEVHNLRVQEEEKDLEEQETYKQIHRFLHLVKNCKILLLSGTPMKDGPEEIAGVTNLILPLKDQFPTGKQFLDEYIEKSEAVIRLKPEKAEELKTKLKGLISFLREPEPAIQKEFIGKQGVGNLKYFVVDPLKMSSFQSSGFEKADAKDKGEVAGIFSNSKEASLFVYPDGSYGREGFEKYIIKRKEGGKKGKAIYRMSPKLLEALRGVNVEDTLKKIRRHSVSYAKVIDEILHTPGNCFIYSNIVQGSGAILFSLLLELFNFSRAFGKERNQGLRYALLTSQTASNNDAIVERFNRIDNAHGDIIKVIIGSKTVSEGLTFKNILFEAINTPHWNYSETAQAIARGIRLGSHNDLINMGEKPTVKILQSVSIPKNSKSYDLYTYTISEIKEISIKSILRVLMECAFDCALNYLRNYVKSEDGSPECNYTYCEYKCDGIDMDNLDLERGELDYSTYQLYYSSPPVPEIRKAIEKLFRENNRLDKDSIIKNLSDKFTEEEITNAILLLEEESKKQGFPENEFSYTTFLKLYSRSPVKQIANKVEELFKNSFTISLESLEEFFGDKYTRFEVLTALQEVINSNLVITNKYGFPCYLREQKNMYFLVNNITVKPGVFLEYYVRNPHIRPISNFTDIMDEIYSEFLPKAINRLCSSQTEKEFSTIMKGLPTPIQELFIEAGLVAEDQNIEKGREIRERILSFFKGYIKTVNNVKISTLPEKLRCWDGRDWRDCNQTYKKLIEKEELERQQSIREANKYGIIAKYNPENDAFCLIDVEKEKEATGKRGKSDKRISHSGKVCNSWKLGQLIEMAVIRLKISPPREFRANDTEEKMVELIKKEKTLFPLLGENPSRNHLRRILYWGTKKEGGIKGIKPICQAIRLWFQSKGLLEIDNQCGVQGKKKLGVAEKEPKRKNFRIEKIVPREREEEFKAYSKEIIKISMECFGKAPELKIDNNMWIFVFSKKKLLGFVMLGTDNIIWNVCVGKNYRKQGIAKEAISQAVSVACGSKGNPTLKVDNRTRDVKKLIRMYKSFGFETERTDEKYTYMKYSCGKEE